MKKTKTTSETTPSKAKVESAAAPKAAETTNQKAKVSKVAAKPAEVAVAKPLVEQAIAPAKESVPAVKEEVAAKPAAKPATKKSKAPAAPKPAAVNTELAMSDRVGLTAGAIWHYLSENGATSVSKLLKELTEEEKIVQRSIGWLAQEDKIVIEMADRIETISLK